MGATLYHLLTGTKPPDALARAAAVISARPDPLQPARELNAAVGAGLSDILHRAMAQNPAARFGSATEFREAIRRLGRAEERERVDFMAGPAVIDAGFVTCAEPSLIAAVHQAPPGSRRNARLAVLLVIVLGSFVTFCHYYPWRFPDRASTAQQSRIAPVERAVKIKERP